MSAAELLAETSRRRLEVFFATARRIPADRLDVSPGGRARSPLNLVQEVAALSEFYAEIAETRTLEFGPDAMPKMAARMASLATIDEAEAACREGTERLLAAAATLTEDDLRIPLSFPWDPIPYSLGAMLYNHVWNLGYHEGQLSYAIDLQS